MGYHRAGWDVTGCDIAPQLNYPFPLHIADAVDFVNAYGGDFDAIHASPPCQRHSALTKGTNQGREHPDIIADLREAMKRTGKPCVIENVPGAPIRRDLWLCGEMFGLGVLRHRNFETGWWRAPQPKHIAHRGYVTGWRHGVWRDGPYVQCYGDGGGKPSVEALQVAMGIDWTADRVSLNEAIPPAYTEYVGRHFLAALP